MNELQYYRFKKVFNWLIISLGIILFVVLIIMMAREGEVILIK